MYVQSELSKGSLMTSKHPLAAIAFFFAICVVDVAHAQKSGRKASPPPATRRPPVSSSGKSTLGPISVANIKFSLDARSDDCPFLIQASDGLKFAGKLESELCGEAPLSWIGKRFGLTQRTSHQAVWRSELQEPYRKCRGRTAAVLWNSEKLTREQSHILLDFSDGWVTLSVNLRKRGPAFAVTSAHVSSSGHPHWCWSQRGEPLARKKRQIEFLGQ